MFNQNHIHVTEVVNLLRKAPGQLSQIIKKPHMDLRIIQDSNYRRRECCVDVRNALTLYTDDIL